jgi:hypothetical protein
VDVALGLSREPGESVEATLARMLRNLFGVKCANLFVVTCGLTRSVTPRSRYDMGPLNIASDFRAAGRLRAF